MLTQENTFSLITPEVWRQQLLFAAVAFAYVVGILVVRWHLIAVPMRQHLQMAIGAARARLHAEGGWESADSPATRDEVARLLEEAQAQIDKTSLWDRLFWSRGREMNGWRYVHEAGRLMASLYQPERVNTRLDRAARELRKVNDPEAAALAAAIEKERESGDDDPGRQPVRRALLKDALAFVYDRRDAEYDFLDTFDNRAMWTVTFGLLLVSGLAQTVGNPVLFLMGAAGGFLGRLTRLINVRFGTSDYGVLWDTLFLSPVMGALAGWTGVLLVVFMADKSVGLLGAAFASIDWNAPYHPYALGLAFMLGLSERFFGRVVAGAQSKLLKPEAEEGEKRTEVGLAA